MPHGQAPRTDYSAARRNRGVLLSMSGYSDEALEGIVRGQQLDMLLLDRTHLEAMLSGLRSPADLPATATSAS